MKGDDDAISARRFPPLSLVTDPYTLIRAMSERVKEIVVIGAGKLTHSLRMRTDGEYLQ